MISPRHTSTPIQKARLAAPTSWITVGSDSKGALSPAHGGPSPPHGGPESFRLGNRRLSANAPTEQRHTTPISNPISMPQATSRHARRSDGSPTAGRWIPSRSRSDLNSQGPRSSRCTFGSTQSIVFDPDVDKLGHLDTSQSEVDALKQKQKEMESNQVTLLSSQVLILMQVTEELQKEFLAFGKDMNRKIDDIRADFSSSLDNALSVKFSWAEANNVSLKTLSDSLANLAAEHTKEIEEHTLSHSAKFAEIRELQEVRLANLEADLRFGPFGIETVRSTMQQELAALQTGQEENLMQVVEDVTSQIVKLKTPMDQMAKDVVAAQEAATALHLELEKHGNEAQEMRVGWLESQSALSKAMDDGFSNLAAEHSRALEEHASSLAKMVEEHHASTQGAKLAEIEELHNERYTQHESAVQRGLEDVHSTVQEELAALRSGHEFNLMQVVQDVTREVDKLKLAFNAEFAKHSSNAESMKADWMEAHSALSKAMDDGLSNLAAKHAKTLEDHASALAKMWEEQQASTQGAMLPEMEKLQRDSCDQHETALQEELKDAQSAWRQEWGKLRSGHDTSLKQVKEDTIAINNLAMSLEQKANGLATEEVKDKRMRLELAQQSNDTAERKAGWETVH